MGEGRASKRQKLAGSKSAPKKASVSSKAAPSKSAQSKSAPAKSAPAKSAPAKPAPAKPAPATPAPATPAPAAPAPAKPAPAKPAPAKPAPMPKSAVSRKRPLPKEEYEDVWEQVYLAGTEWAQIQEVHEEEWDFEHLDDALTDGELSGKMVHLFGATEPQLIMRDEEDAKGSIIPVPVIIAVESARPPPSTIGIKSVQRTEEEIIPMSTLKMAWHPHVPENLTGSRRFKPRVHVLKCEQRRARLRNMTEAAVHKYDYVLPYIIRPGQEEDVTLDTEVQVLVDLEGRNVPVMMQFDFELDELDEFVEEQIKDNKLEAEKCTEVLKTAIRDQVRATKLKYKEEKAARQKRIDDIPQEDRDAMKEMRLLKFYPQNEWPDVSKIKSKFINRYYGRADKVL